MNSTDLKKFEDGVALAQAGKKAEAHSSLRSLLQTHPTDSTLLMWVAYTSKDLTEARKLVEVLQSNDPDNNYLPSAQIWLESQEKQRLGKRFRNDIKGHFVPPMPTTGPLQASQTQSATQTVASGWAMTGQGQSLAVAVAPVKAAVSQSTKPAALVAENKLLKLEIEQPKKAAKVRSPKAFSWLNKILVGFFILIVLAGGLLAVPQVREALFNTGPLTIAEQNYVNEVNGINDLTTNAINNAYNCMIPGVRSCSMDDAYKTVYVRLGELRDRFQALKVPSSRFVGIHATLTSAYNSLGSSSAFAFETITQKKTVSNVSEMLTRLDSGRKLIEQGKAELKTATQTFSKK